MLCMFFNLFCPLKIMFLKSYRIAEYGYNLLLLSSSLCPIAHILFVLLSMAIGWFLVSSSLSAALSIFINASWDRIVSLEFIPRSGIARS